MTALTLAFLITSSSNAKGYIHPCGFRAYHYGFMKASPLPLYLSLSLSLSLSLFRSLSLSLSLSLSTFEAQGSISTPVLKRHIGCVWLYGSLGSCDTWAGMRC